MPFLKSFYNAIKQIIEAYTKVHKFDSCKCNKIERECKFDIKKKLVINEFMNNNPSDIENFIIVFFFFE